MPGSTDSPTPQAFEPGAPASLKAISAYVAALCSGDAPQMNALRGPDFVLDFVHGDAFQNKPLSYQETRDFWPAWFAAFPEMDLEVTRTIAAESVAVVQWTFTGTHAGPLGPPVFDPPVKPSGRTICLRGVSVYDVQGDLLQRETTYVDLATLMVELGVEP